MKPPVTMLDTIHPKSDQLNADDLIGGPLTITVAKVTLTGEEQPVAIHFQNDGGKPFKPGKSMRRVLVMLWGPDANQYVGKSMRLYRDEKIMFGGEAVGGIRISHMTDIGSEDQTVALMVTKGRRKPFTVHPLRAAQKPQEPRKPAQAAPPPEDDTPAYDGPDFAPEEVVTRVIETPEAAEPDPLLATITVDDKPGALAWAQGYMAVGLKKKSPAELMALWRYHYDSRVTPLKEMWPEVYDSLEAWMEQRMKKLRQEAATT